MRFSILIILLFTFSILFLQSTAYGQDSLGFQPVGEIRGNKVLFVSGDKMLVEDLEEDYHHDIYHKEIVLWDIMNPAEPEQLHRCLPSLNRAEMNYGYRLRFCSDAILKDTLIFAMLTGNSQYGNNMSIGPSDLIIYDISNQNILCQVSFESYYYHFNPDSPEPVAVLPGVLALSDDYLYVAQGMDGIFIYDVSDPANAEEVANLEFKSNNLVLYNDLLIFIYFHDGEGLFLFIFDVSDPTNPEWLSEVSLNIGVSGHTLSVGNELCIWDDYLYLFPYIYDISGEEPECVRRIEADFIGHNPRYAISAGKVFFKDSYSLGAFDLADPLNPELICLLPDTSYYRNLISAYDDFIYITPVYPEPWPEEGTVRILHFGEPTAIEPDDQNLPGDFRLYPAYPNPFNASTKISYQLPEAGEVSINIYDIRGRLVATLVEGKTNAGLHSVVWDGSSVPSGIYLCHMRASGYSRSVKMVLVK